MEVKILSEHGYELALRGMSYSFKDRSADVEDWWEAQLQKAIKRAGLLAGKGAGHDKFLRQIQVWVDVEAPRCFWCEFDTYRVGVVENSESTLHTLSKRPPTKYDFEEDTPESTIEAFKEVWKGASSNAPFDITVLKCALPEGFLQRRLVTLNYENLRNIIKQRTGHRLKYWGMFIESILAQAEHPELLTFKESND